MSILGHIREVLALLKQYQLFAKWSNYKFSVEEIDYLGHVINAQGAMVDYSKVVSILEWPEPKNMKSL